MKKIFALMFLVLLAGCKLIPVPEMNSKPIAYKLTETEVRQAIIKSGFSRNWKMAPTKDGSIRATLNVRSHQLILDIPYSSTEYSLNYVDSVNLKYKDGKIHKKVASWMKNLDLDIQRALFEMSIK